jgi:RimJ/RimL family protein N-acetyltransferase
MDIVKRAVSMIDAEIILGWRNSASARSASPEGNPLGQLEHENWLSSRIARHPNEPFWIMSIAEEPVGFFRLDLSSETQHLFTVSIFTVPKSRGSGVGRLMLREALDFAISRNAETGLRAVIKKDNNASIALFKGFGFELAAQIDSNFDEYRVTPNRINLNAPYI